MKKLFLAVPLLFFPLVSLAHYGDDAFFSHHMMDGTGWGGYGIFGAGIFMIIIWLLLIIAVVYLVFHGLGGGKKMDWKEWKEGKGHGRAMDILKERYAKGEIGKEDFEKMKKDLE